MFATHLRSRVQLVPNYGIVWNRFALVLPLAMLLILLVFGGALVGWLAKAAPREQTLAGFSTSLKGRTRGQRHNARLAARSLDGRVIAPQGVFSFNQTVKSWSVDGGYSKALVSYDGELVRAYGGGVCQTSTTLYNAALLAGLPILERHPHVFVPGYIAPGRDAAVAYPGIDLRFRNSNPWPIRIRAHVRGDRLEISLCATQTTISSGQSQLAKDANARTRNTQGQSVQAPPDHQSPSSVRIETQVLSVSAPQRMTRVRFQNEAAMPQRAYLHSAGATGYRVVTFRVFSRNGRELRREHLGDDTYPAMNRVLALIRDAS